MRRLLSAGIIGMVMLSSSISPVFSRDNKYNVYTPSTYKQVDIAQAPRNFRVTGYAVELLVDYSGSMRPWIQLTTETLEYILPKIPKDTATALRVFGEINGGNAGYNFIDSCRATRLATFFKHNNQASIIRGLREATVGGMTPLEFALRETVKKDLRHVRVYNNGKSATKNKKIILVTDGYDSCGGDPCAYIREIMKTSEDIQIDVVQIGASTALMCLTAETGGSFYKVNGDKDKFIDAFESTFGVPKGTVKESKNIERKAEPEPQPKSQPQPPQTQPQQPQPRGYKFINF